MKTPTVFAGFLFCLIPLSFYPYVLDAVLLPRLLVTICIVLLFSFVSLTQIKIFNLNTLLQSPLFIVFSILALATIITPRTPLDVPEDTLYILKTLCYFFLFITTHVLFSVTSKKSVFKIIAISNLIVLSIAFCQIAILHFNIQFTFYGEIERIHSEALFANKNIFATCLFLYIPFLVYLTVTGSTREKTLYSIQTLVTIVLIIQSQTKSVIIGLIISVFLIFVLLSIFNKQNKRLIFIYSILFFIAFGTIAIILNYSKLYEFISFFLNFDVVSVISSPNLLPESSKLEHTLMLKNSISMIKDHFWQGVGGGNWKYFFYQYGSGGTPFLNKGFVRFDRAHNDFIQLFCEGGVLCFLAFLSLFIISFFNYLRFICSKSDIIWGYCGAFGIVGFFIISLFTFSVERIFPSILFISLLSFSQKFPDTKKFKQNRTLSIGIFITIILISIYSIYWFSDRIRDEKHLYIAYNLKRTNKSTNEQIYYQIARESRLALSDKLLADPTGTPIQWYAGSALFNLGKIDEALQQFIAAEKINPYHVNLLNDIAGCYFHKKNINMAITYYKKTLLVTPRFEDALRNLSIIYYNSNNIESSLFYFLQIALPENTSPDQFNTEYKSLWIHILKRKIDILISKTSDDQVKNKLQNLSENEEKLLKIYFVLKKNKYNLDELIFS